MRRTTLFVSLAVLTFAGCDLDYPRVVVVNRIGPEVVVRDPSFNGCHWATILNYGDHTAMKACLPGRGRVHFKKLDLAQYSAGGSQADDGTPRWFNYQTASSLEAGPGDNVILELTREDMEQDFSVPGPYGH